jgi:hypothetical protein
LLACDRALSFSFPVLQPINFELKSPMTITENFPSTIPVGNKENLKLWLCELTHLTPHQVERLMEQMEERKSQPLESAAH